ncbi:MAG: hypothetical protein AAGA42_09175 [Actinomycetota bacterium]
MTRRTRSTIARFVGGIVAACTAITVLGSASASAGDDMTSASTNPLEPNICYTDNPLGEGYRVHVTTTNHSTRNALFEVEEVRGDVRHRETLRPGETGVFAHDAPLDRERTYIYDGQVDGMSQPDAGFSWMTTNVISPDFAPPCF